MVSMAGAGLEMTSQETGPEQLPARPRLAPVEPPAPAEPSAPAEPPALAPRDRPRPLEVAQCSMCGVALPLGLLVPDGGPGCPDVRWYCKDARSCTERWTTARPSA
jgi:hypothetical protein